MTLFIEKKSFFVSLLGHLIFFFLFEISLGHIFLNLNYSEINFWGAFLKNTELTNINNKRSFYNTKDSVFRRVNLRFLVADLKLKKEEYRLEKPNLVSNLLFLEKRTHFFDSPKFEINKNKHEIFLYPVLPEHFLLYFKDRQKILVSISFSFLSRGGLPFLSIERKRSSGNLEIDLLVMRYLTHYLYRLKDFPLNQWRVVDIELTKKND